MAVQTGEVRIKYIFVDSQGASHESYSKPFTLNIQSTTEIPITGDVWTNTKASNGDGAQKLVDGVTGSLGDWITNTDEVTYASVCINFGSCNQVNKVRIWNSHY